MRKYLEEDGGGGGTKWKGWEKNIFTEQHGDKRKHLLFPWRQVPRCSPSCWSGKHWCRDKKKKKANGSMVTTFSRSAFLFSPLARLKRVNRKSQRAQWIMVMPQRAQVHDGNGDERAEVGRGGYWGRLWKYEGLEFRVSSAVRRLRESYLKQINFLRRSLSLSLALSLAHSVSAN